MRKRTFGIGNVQPSAGIISPVKTGMKILLSAIIVLVVVLIYFYFRYPKTVGRVSRTAKVLAWLQNADSYPEWQVNAGDQCTGAPFIMPTDGFIGYLWGDHFRLGHTHQGIDIFSGTDAGDTAVVSAYSGYLTRMDDWRSTVIIRIPEDPLKPGRQVWTYYTHMADSMGHSLIAPEFPPGTTEVYVEQGAFLGYQGNYSGTVGKPVGVHLHFSIVLDDGSGHYLNELAYENTLDPSPYFKINLNGDKNGDGSTECGED